MYVWDISCDCDMDVILQPAAVNTVSMSFFIKQWMKMFDTHHTLPLASVTHCLMYLPLFIGEGK